MWHDPPAKLGLLLALLCCGIRSVLSDESTCARDSKGLLTTCLLVGTTPAFDNKFSMALLQQINHDTSHRPSPDVATVAFLDGHRVMIDDESRRPPAHDSVRLDDAVPERTNGKCKPINKTCKALAGNQIDWDCVLGPGALSEVTQRGGRFTTCPDATKSEPCSRFIVAKDSERAEVKVKDGAAGFPFRKGEEYVFKYSFKPKKGMKVGKLFTILGQLKGSADGEMLKGVPLYSIVANRNGIMVRFSNLDETIPNYHPGLDNYLSWEDALGKWVHVEVTSVLGKSMEVKLSGAVSGKAVWPSHLKPVAWHRDAERARLKLGLYHSIHNVADGEVDYKNISVEGPNGIIRSSPVSSDDDDDDEEEQVCSADDPGKCERVDIICEPLRGNQIDWDCIFGPDSLEEVESRGGTFTTCPRATKLEPCSRFIVEKSKERAEVKVQEGPPGFTFLKGDLYVFKYSFRAKKGMRVSKQITRLGQLKGSRGGYMVSGEPIYSLTANNDGLMVRFSNEESIEGSHPGMEEHMSWEDSTGEWVHVDIRTVFGKSMEVTISGAVEGKAVWPQNLKPVAWNNAGDMVRMKLGLFHAANKVADGEVEYKNISIEGPAGIIRTSSKGVPDVGVPEGVAYVACVADDRKDRVLTNMFKHRRMTPERCADYCEGQDYFGTQYGRECWCGSEGSEVHRHGLGKCDSPCEGDEEQTCGGLNAISLYRYSSHPEEVPEGSKYLGCYRDDRRDRVLTGTSTSCSKMSQEACFDFCKKSRSKYFGLEFGEECFCGNPSDVYDRLGTSMCSMECPGEPGVMCGGKNAIGVYSIY